MHSYTSKLRWWARCLTFGPDFIWRFVRRPTAPHHRQGRRLPTVLCVIDTHRNEDASAVKTRIMTFGSIASRLSGLLTCRRISTIVGSGYGWIIVLDLERLHLLS